MQDIRIVLVYVAAINIWCLAYFLEIVTKVTKGKKREDFTSFLPKLGFVNHAVNDKVPAPTNKTNS